MLCVVESLHVSCPFVLLPPDFLPCGARYLATTINEALDELNSKLGKVVRMEVQEIDLGASPLQILGVKVRRAFKKRFLKFSEPASFCSRFAWTEKQNTPMCIGTCSLDVPTSAQPVQHPFCGRLEITKETVRVTVPLEVPKRSFCVHRGPRFLLLCLYRWARQVFLASSPPLFPSHSRRGVGPRCSIPRLQQCPVGGTVGAAPSRGTAWHSASTLKSRRGGLAWGLDLDRR